MSKVRSLTAVPRPAGQADFRGISLSPQEGFLLSRIDGATPSEMLAQLVGMTAEQVADAIQHLWELGLVEIAGVERPVAQPKPSPVAKTGAASHRPARRPSASQPTSSRPSSSRPSSSGGRKKKGEGARARLRRDMVPASWPVQIASVEIAGGEMVPEETVPADDQLVVRCFAENLEKLSYYELFQVDSEVGRRDLRRAYFKLSKAFHPDHWFRQELGQFSSDVARVFKWVNKAYAVLSSPQKREAYDRVIATGVKGEWQLEGEGKAPRGPSRFEQLRSDGAKAEGRRDFATALKHFGAALKLRTDGEVLLHMAMCELQLGRPSHSVEILLARARGARASENACLLVEAHLSRRDGRNERARRLYQAVLDREPSSRDAAEGLRALKN